MTMPSKPDAAVWKALLMLLSEIYAAAVNLDLKANLQQQREGRGCEETTRLHLD